MTSLISFLVYSFSLETQEESIGSALFSLETLSRLERERERMRIAAGWSLNRTVAPLLNPVTSSASRQN